MHEKHRLRVANIVVVVVAAVVAVVAVVALVVDVVVVFCHMIHPTCQPQLYEIPPRTPERGCRCTRFVVIA